MAATVTGVEYNQSGLQFSDGRWQDRILVKVKNATGATGDYDAIAAVRANGFELNTVNPKNGSMTVNGWAINNADQANGYYEVWVIYTVPIGGQQKPVASNPDDLLNLPATVNWNFGFYQEITEFDRFGEVICNSAGDVYDPPVTIDRVEGIMTITKYQRGYDASFWKDKIGSVNNADVILAGMGKAAKRTAQLLSVSPTSDYVATISVPFTYGLTSPVFVAGDVVTFGSGGTATVVAVNPSGLGGTLLVTAITHNVSNGTTITAGSPSTAHGTANAAVAVAPVQIVAKIRYRKLGMDNYIVDQGTGGWWKTVDNTPFKGKILRKDRHELDTNVLLHEGAPAQTSVYVADSANFDAWDTSQDALASRVTDNKVKRTTTGYMDQLLFERIDETDFSAFGL